MQLTLRDLERAVQRANKLGARGTEILVSETQDTTCSASGRGTPAVRGSSGERCQVRCWVEGGRLGEASGRISELDRLIEQALERAPLGAEDPFGGPVERLSPSTRGLGIDDRRHEQLTDADRTDVIISNQRAAAKVSAAVEVGTFSYRDRRERRVFVSSKGVQREEYGTTYEGRGVVRLRDDPTTELNEHIAMRAFAGVSCLPFGVMLAQRAASLIEIGPAIDGPIRVLLGSRPAARLVAWLAPLFDAQILERGGTLLHNPEGGFVELHRRLHLVEDGALPGGLRTRGFDDRGVPAVPLTLIREGTIDARYLDVQTARRLETRPTGHDHDGALRPTNLQLNGGVRSINAFMGEQPEPVFVVDDLPDLDGLDVATGRMDLPVHGHLRQGHQIKGARRHARLQGNLITALQQVVALTSDTDRILHVDAPGVFVDGLTIVG
jgi:predicted Zn-dependent protease